jgi:hypothetical protein
MSKGTAFNSDDVQRITAGTHDPEEIAVLAAKQLSPP